MEIIPRCDVCNIDIQRASFAKHWRNKKLMENETQNELTLPTRFFK